MSQWRALLMLLTAEAQRFSGRIARALTCGLSVSALACAPDPTTQTEVEPYVGDPYPQVVPNIAYPAVAALVTDSLSDSVSVLDLAKGKRVDVRPVGRIPVDIDGPHHLALDARGGFAYVALSYPDRGASGPHATHGKSESFGYVQKLLLSDLSIVGQVRVEKNPGDILISKDGKRVITSHFDLQRAVENATDYERAKAAIALVDTATFTPAGIGAAKLIPTCVAPHGMELNGAASLLYVACYGEDRLGIVNLEGSQPDVQLVDVGAGVSSFGSPKYGPYALRLSADETLLIVSNTASKDVRFFDTKAGQFDEDRTITTQGAPFFVDVSAPLHKLYIPTQVPDALVVVDLMGVEETVTRPFTDVECKLPHAVREFDGKLFVLCEGDHVEPGNVIGLDEDLKVISNIAVGVYPDSLLIVGGLE